MVYAQVTDRADLKTHDGDVPASRGLRAHGPGMLTADGEDYDEARRSPKQPTIWDPKPTPAFQSWHNDPENQKGKARDSRVWKIKNFGVDSSQLSVEELLVRHLPLTPLLASDLAAQINARMLKAVGVNSKTASEGSTAAAAAKYRRRRTEAPKTMQALEVPCEQHRQGSKRVTESPSAKTLESQAPRPLESPTAEDGTKWKSQSSAGSSSPGTSRTTSPRKTKMLGAPPMVTVQEVSEQTEEDKLSIGTPTTRTRAVDGLAHEGRLRIPVSPRSLSPTVRQQQQPFGPVRSTLSEDQWEKVEDAFSGLAFAQNGRSRSAPSSPRRGRAVSSKQTMKEFKTFLIGRFGHLVRAWRVALDPMNHGVIAWQEFGRHVRALGFHGSSVAVWRELDEDGNGVITMNELCPAEADGLDAFKGMLADRFKFAEAAWKALGAKGQKPLTCAEFCEGCKRIGWNHTPHRIHAWLVRDPYGGKSVKLEDMLWLGLPTSERRFNGKVQREMLEKQKDEEKRSMLSPHTLADFKTFLRSRFGNLARGWRLALDTDGNGSLTREGFGKAVRDVGYTGSIIALWKELDQDGGGLITLDELDSKLAADLAGFRDFLLQRWFSAEDAWSKALATKGQATLASAEFMESCRKIGYFGDAAKMHHYLRGDPWGGQTIDVKDLMWLGVPSGVKAEDGREKRERLVSELREERARAVGPHNMEGFHVFLKARYGNLVRAWRLAMCSGKNLNGALSKTEFGRSVRELGYSGSIKQLWKDLDSDGGGTISLFEFAPDLFEVLEAFRDCLVDRGFGDSQTAWQKGVSPKGHNNLSEKEFVHAVKALEYQGDARLLHNLLSSDPHGACFITIEDLEYLGLQPRPQQLSLLEKRKQKEAEVAAREASHQFMKNPKEFKEALWRHFGNMVRAWRFAFADAPDTSLTQSDFIKRSKELGYVGPGDDLWKDWIGGCVATRMNLQIVVPYIVEELQLFRKLLQGLGAKASSGSTAWTEVFHAGEEDVLAPEDVAEVCRQIEWQRDPVRLCRLLSSGRESDSKQLRLRDIEWLYGLPAIPVDGSTKE